MSRYCPFYQENVIYARCQECDKECEKFALLVVGSRTFNDYDKLRTALDNFLINKKDVIIVSGGARGADSLAKRYALEKGFVYKEFAADWSIGKSAGYIRNDKMHQFIAGFKDRGVVAFWDGKSKGTAHNFPLCDRYNNAMRVVRI